VNIEIDWTRCDGHGLCAELLPSRITVDEWGYPIIAGTDIDASEENNVRRTIGVCPALALRLVDSRTTK
jgi:ferredoxin